MGKKQHQQDKLYLTSTEWTMMYGGKRANHRLENTKNTAKSLSQNILPLDFCALSLRPFYIPITTHEGYVFDFIKLMEHFKAVKKQARLANTNTEEIKKVPLVNPVTGTPFKDVTNEIIALRFHKNNAEEFHCPITFKTLHDNSHIVAIRTTGNVYSMEAIESLNLKPKHYKDLLTDEPFVPSRDIIVIRDPSNFETKLNIGTFKHILANMDVRLYGNETNSLNPEIDNKLGELLEQGKRLREDYVGTDFSQGGAALKRKLKTMNYVNVEMDHIMREYLEKFPDSLEAKAEGGQATDLGNRGEINESLITYAHYSKGTVAMGLTCSAVAPQTEQVLEILDADAVRYSKIRTKGYVQVMTNLGNLNFELHCDAAPRTCENFLLLARKGFYDNLLFFRSIRHFVVQTGDPNLEHGKKLKKDTPLKPRNSSFWGGYIPDELKMAGSYPHKGRGILSSANAGIPNTNGSQWFITYRSASSLDKKHTVFGRVVGGLKTLDLIEKVETDLKDQPTTDVYIVKINIYKDPFEELREKEEREAIEKAERLQQENENKKIDIPIKRKFDTNQSNNPVKKPTMIANNSRTIGKYLNIKK